MFIFGRNEIDVAENVRQTLVPAKPGAFEAVQGLANDKCVSLSIAKFRACNYVCLFLRVRFKTGIANVGGPDFKVVEFSYKSKESNAMEGNDT